MEYHAASQLISNMTGVIVMLNSVETPVVADEAGITVSAKDGVYKCPYRDTPSPVVKRMPGGHWVDFNCHGPSTRLFRVPRTSTADAETLIVAWRTMAAGRPAEKKEPVAVPPTSVVAAGAAPSVSSANSSAAVRRDYLRALEQLSTLSLTAFKYRPYPEMNGVAANERGVVFSIKGGGSVVLEYADTPDPKMDHKNVMLRSIGDPPLSIHLVGQNGLKFTLLTTEAWSKTFVDAWLVASRGPPPETAETMAGFESAATAYRADPNAFVLPENVRVLKVQAETAVRGKRLWDAADRFAQALDLSPAWGAGRFNLALVYGELGLRQLAIAEMEKYLKLAPAEENARAAQDRIYSWQEMSKRWWAPAH